MALIGAGRGSDALWRNEPRAGKTTDNYQRRQSNVTRVQSFRNTHCGDAVACAVVVIVAHGSLWHII